MNRLSILSVLLAFCQVAAAQLPSQEDIKRVVGIIAGITGLEVKKPVPYETISRDGWKQWVEEQIQLHVKPEELRAEELALKKFGLLPQDYDLRKATVELLSEQAAAVYDHRKKRMMFIEGGAGSAAALEEKLNTKAAGMAMDEMLLVHELSHALVDQHFDLNKFIEKGPLSDDAQTARMAVVEGQAMWIMLEAQLNKIGWSLATSDATLDRFSSSMAGSMEGMFPVFETAPLYMRESLMFPYVGGMRFQQKAFEKYGKKSFTEVLTRPPSSTREIIHPEVWLERTKPVKTKVPEFANLKDYNSLTSGSIGELDFRILLTQYLSESDAAQVSPKWRAGVFDLLEGKRDKRAVLRWSAVWENEAAARSFLAAYKKVLARKWKAYNAMKDAADAVEGTGDDGRFVIRISGATVSGVEGMQP